jgi:hypothetical protein
MIPTRTLLATTRAIVGTPRGALAVIVMLLAACASSAIDTGELPDADAINGMSRIQARAIFINQTIMIHGPRPQICLRPDSDAPCKTDNNLGTEIEYLSENGFAYRWYPGNLATESLRWDVARHREKKRYFICFLRPEGRPIPPASEHSFNPACYDIADYMRGVVEMRVSDLFNLSRRSASDMLQSKRTTFDDLLRGLARL